MFLAEAIDEAEPCGRCLVCRLAALITEARYTLAEVDDDDDDEALVALEAALDEGCEALAMLLGEDGDLDDYKVGDVIRVSQLDPAPTRH